MLKTRIKVGATSLETAAKKVNNRISKQVDTSAMEDEPPMKQTAYATRPIPVGQKCISLVPEHDPWKSPSLDYSRHVHLTSNWDDQDPAKIVKRLERNKLVHGNFDVHLVTQHCRDQFQEIIDSKLSKEDDNYVNVKKKFKEKAPSVIEQL